MEEPVRDATKGPSKKACPDSDDENTVNTYILVLLDRISLLMDKPLAN